MSGREIIRVEQIDVAVIGAGVTGLASARAIAARGFSTCVLERHPRPGLDTSTHNSGVIHAGLYYPAGSLKARLCVEGRHLMYEFCAAHHVPHAAVRQARRRRRRDRDCPRSRRSCSAASATASKGWSSSTGRSSPPASRPCTAWPRSTRPESGIVERRGTGQGAAAVRRSPRGSSSCRARGCSARNPMDGGIALRTERETILARQVVNAGGTVRRRRLATARRRDRSRSIRRAASTRSSTPAKRSLVNALVYPLPHGHGLGRPSGEDDHRASCGSDRRCTIRIARTTTRSAGSPSKSSSSRRGGCCASITIDDLRLSGSGIRAKLHPPSETFADFLIRRDSKNPAVVQAAGIDSPGLTSCLAVGKLVSEIVEEGFGKSKDVRI